MVGTIVFGHIECYFIMNADQAKDANMECTVIARTLDLINAKLSADDHALPRSLVIGADNTVREAKNQHFCSFLAYLKATARCDAIESEFQLVGHTHNEQDQICSIAASLFAKSPELETPADFRDRLFVACDTSR